MANLFPDLDNVRTVAELLCFGDALHRGTPLLDPPTLSSEQVFARRWRKYECDKIQADIYRAQERRPA